MKLNVQAFKQPLHCWCPIVNQYRHIVPFIDMHLNSNCFPGWRYSKLNYGKMHLHIMVPAGMWQKMVQCKESGIEESIYQFCI